MAIPFAVDWSPSAWCEGPPRLAHALSAAAASALQPRAYAGTERVRGCGYFECYYLEKISDSILKDFPNYNLYLFIDGDRSNTGRHWKPEQLLEYCCCYPWYWKQGVFCSRLATTMAVSLWGNWTQCTWMAINCRQLCIVMSVGAKCTQFIISGLSKIWQTKFKKIKYSPKQCRLSN